MADRHVTDVLLKLFQFYKKKCVPAGQSAEVDISDEIFIDKISSIRGKRIMLDTDLAELYGVPTKRLNEKVKRNAKRFPEDFMFTLLRTRSKF
ncbi:MAG: ORF6N domain-containing protein [Chryseolinea sp.]